MTPHDRNDLDPESVRDDPKLREHIRKAVEAAPPLTPEQRAVIADALRSAARVRLMAKIKRAGEKRMGW